MTSAGRIERFMTASMRMDDKVWARHANKRSVRTRIPLGAALLLAIWSHVLIGWAAALAITGALALWAFVNPRAFPPPADLSSWESRGTLGEQIWLARHREPIPAHHARAAGILALVAGLGFIVGIVGALVGNLATTLAGAAIGTLAKLWFVDRMVWLHDETRAGSAGPEAAA